MYEWPNRDPLGEAGFETRRRRRANTEGDGPNVYLFTRNDAVNETDLLGLAVDPAFCQKWYNDCWTSALSGTGSCLCSFGPSWGTGVAACVIGCAPFAAGGVHAYATCLAICAGADTLINAGGSPICWNAFYKAMKGCNAGYDRCMSKTGLY